jgi:hypothetical protein
MFEISKDTLVFLAIIFVILFWQGLSIYGHYVNHKWEMQRITKKHELTMSAINNIKDIYVKGMYLTDTISEE